MFKGTLVLALLLLGLGALYYYGRAEPVRDANSLSMAVLDGYTLAGADRIKIRRGVDVPPIVLEKDSEGFWWLVEPIRDLASRARLQAVAQAYDSAMMEPAFPDRGPADAETLAMTGLDEPQAILQLEFAARGGSGGGDVGGGDAPNSAAKKIEVRIGAAGPLNTDLYLLRDGVIYRGGMGLASALQLNVTDLRERVMVRNTMNSARSVVLKQYAEPDQAGGGQSKEPIQTLRLERNGRGEWQLVEPIAVRTDPFEARRLVQQLLSLRAEEFMAGALNQPGPIPHVEMIVEGPMLESGPLVDRVQIWIRNLDMLAYGLADGRTEGFTVHPQLFATVFRDAVNALRARFLVPFSIDELEMLTIEIPEEPLITMRRDPLEGLRLVEPADMRMRPRPMQELMSAVRALRVEGFVDGAPDDPQFGLVGGMQVQLRGGRGQGPTNLVFGGPVEAPVGAGDNAIPYTYCQRKGEAEVVKVRTAIVDVLRRDWVEFVSPQICAQPNPPQQLLLQWTPGGGTGAREDRTWVRNDGEWRDRQQNPVRGAGDEDLLRLQGFIDEFRDLEAVRVLREEEEPEGVAVTLTIARENGDALQKLELVVPNFAAPQGAVFAARSKYPGLRFELPKSFRDTLRWLLQSD